MYAKLNSETADWSALRVLDIMKPWDYASYYDIHDHLTSLCQETVLGLVFDDGKKAYAIENKKGIWKKMGTEEPIEGLMTVSKGWRLAFFVRWEQVHKSAYHEELLNSDSVRVSPAIFQQITGKAEFGKTNQWRSEC